MSNRLEEVVNIVKDFTLEERAQLAGSLLLSLDEPSESEIERLWLEEAKRRLKAFKEGKASSRPSEEVFERAVADIL